MKWIKTSDRLPNPEIIQHLVCRYIDGVTRYRFVITPMVTRRGLEWLKEELEGLEWLDEHSFKEEIWESYESGYNEGYSKGFEEGEKRNMPNKNQKKHEVD